MARRFNGSSDDILFTLPAALQSLTAGNMTIVFVANFTDATDGAMIHTRTSGGTDCWWMESFTTWNYGQAAVARNVGALSIGSWAAYIGRKAAGGSVAPRGRKIIYGGATTDVTAGSTLADGTAPGAGGALRVGRWGVTTERIAADVAAVAVFASDLSDGTTATFTTWANILAASPAWAVHFDQASPTDAITDATGGGGNSSTITGTTIVANPSGFFAGGGSTVNAVLAATLPSPTAAIVAKPTVNAVLAATLPAPAASITAKPTVKAVLATSLPAPAASITAKPTVKAALAGQLPALSASITAKPTVKAALVSSLPAPLALMTARAPVRAVLAAVLPAPAAHILKDQVQYVTATLTAGGLERASLAPTASALAALSASAAPTAILSAGVI